MQLAFTFDFAEARRAHDEAAAALYVDCDPTELPDPVYQSLSSAEHAALDVLLATPAGTVAGLGHKLFLVEEREIETWTDWPQHRAEIERDLVELRRPNATLHKPFEAWRAARDALEACTGSDDVADDLSSAESEAFESLISSACATPGDFLVKAYVGLIEALGSGSRRIDTWRSIWDVSIDKADGPTFDNLWRCSAYHDLDQSDLGACLLAFGLLDFDADAWLSRAQALGIPIGLHLEGDDRRGLKIGMHHVGRDARWHRERARLERLIAFNPRRADAVADAIMRDWPQLVEPASAAA